MGETTEIEWADATWNPWWGCTKVSPACANCYAEGLSNRFYNGLWRGQRRRVKDWSLPGRVDRRAVREGRRLRLFVASMADVFDAHPAVTEWRRAALEMLALLHAVDVLLLTKRPENIPRMVPPGWLDAWPAHVWVGTTVEDQQRAEERIPHLLRVPARVRFVSCEPALGPVDFDSIVCDTESMVGRPTGGRRYDALRGSLTCWPPKPQEGPRINWVIAGGESGPKARPSSLPAARALRDQCARAGVAFLWKQWGEWGPANGYDFDAGPYPAVKVDGHPMVRVGKKAAGRLLDGVQHNGFPREEVSRG